MRLLHDQTEATDGDRTRQHEGWPAPKEGDAEPRWKAEAQERSAQAESGSETDDPASPENGRA